jgi:hypothetical protein
LPHFASQPFEDICAEWMRRNPERLPFRPSRIGRWWDRAHELDIVAYNDHDVLFGECKWTSAPAGPATLAHLTDVAGQVPGFERHRKHFALFSKAGTHKGVGDALQFDLAELLGIP